MGKQIRIILYCLLLSILMSTHLQAEQWKINFNSYPGVMELNKSGTSYSGRFNLHGTWEQMLDLQVYRNAIFFRRASADQKYLGVMEHGRMQGVFTQHGSGRYPWTAEQSESAGANPVVTVPPPAETGSGIPVTIYWHMADDADVYLNGRPLRTYSPSFKTRPDEAPRPAFSARATLRQGDIFTVGGRRGGSYGLMLLAVDDNGRVVFKTDSSSWMVYEPGERPDWHHPSVADSSRKRPVTIQHDPWYPQKELNTKYQNRAQSIWSEPDKRYAYLLGIVKGIDQPSLSRNPAGTWRHHPNATWVIVKTANGGYHAQEHGLGNASGPAYFTPSGNFRIDYVTRDGAVKGFYEVTIAPDGRTAVGRVQELSGPKRSGTTNWTRQ